MKTCETCRWWEENPDHESNVRGLCGALIERGLVVDHYQVFTDTRHDFGCNQWEAKEKEGGK